MALAQLQFHSIPSELKTMDTERAPSSLSRGVHITEFKETDVNPEPVVLEETEILLEQYLSPRKLKLLTGVDNLEEVTSLELKVDTTETSLGNFGALLPNLTQLKMSESVVHSIRDIGSSLRGVRVLWMSQCGLCEVDGISSMNSLQEVYLPYNEICDISSLSMLDDLQVLDLEGNNIDDIDQMQYLALCQKLKRLTIEGNPVCVMRKPDSEEINYNYRDAVQSILPNIEILDDEPLVIGSQPSSSLNAFDKDWEYLEELQNDALLQTPREEDSPTESSSCTSVLRPVTAFRPGSALRPSSGFRPTTASRRPATISGRPSTSLRPTTAFAERPASSDAVDSNEVGGASDLTLGGVICGNPSRALRERKKLTPSKTPDINLGSKKSSIEEKDEDDEDEMGSIVEELKEWRREHNERMNKLQASKTAQVLIIDHNSDEEDDNSLNSSIISVNIKQRQSKHLLQDNGNGDKHDEQFDVESTRNTPQTHNNKHIDDKIHTRSDRNRNEKILPKDSSYNLGPVRSPTSERPLPPPVPRASSSRGTLSTPPRMRRQLPQVPTLPSKPFVPKS